MQQISMIPIKKDRALEIYCGGKLQSKPNSDALLEPDLSDTIRYDKIE